MLWRDGKSLCEQDGAALPVPLSDEENKFIADLNYHEDTWLGINDLETEGTFVDNDGKPITYSNWFRGEPNDLYGEDIAHIGVILEDIRSGMTTMKQYVAQDILKRSFAFTKNLKHHSPWI